MAFFIVVPDVRATLNIATSLDDPIVDVSMPCDWHLSFFLQVDTMLIVTRGSH